MNLDLWEQGARAVEVVVPKFRSNNQSSLETETSGSPS